MPLDTSIPLQAQAPQLNPLQMALQAAQFRAFNANGLAAQQQLAANRATSQAYQQAVDPNTGQLDTNKLSALIAQNPDSAYNYAQTMKSVMDARQAQQTYDRGQIGLNDDQIENAKKAYTYTAQRFGTLDPNDPDFSGKLLGVAADTVKYGHVDPNVVISSLANVPPDPAGRAAWLQRGISAAQDAAAQLNSITPKPAQVDTGGAITYQDTNPISNPSIVGTTMQKSLDPATASTPTPAYDPATGQTGNIPRSQFASGGPPPIPTIPQPANMPTGSGGAAPMPSGPVPGAAPAGPRGFVPTGPALGASGIADAAGQRYATLQSAAANAKGLMNTYDLASNAVNGAIAQGKGSSSIANAGGVVQTLLGAFGAKPTGDSVKDYQLATNYLNSATDQAAASLGLSGSDSRLAAAKAGQPDPNNMNLPALQQAIAHAKGLQQAVLDRQQATTNFLAQNGNSTANLNQFEAKWNKSFNPDVSYVRSLNSPQQQQAAMQQLKAQGALGAWMKDYQAMKDMGAF